MANIGMILGAGYSVHSHGNDLIRTGEHAAIWTSIRLTITWLFKQYPVACVVVVLAVCAAVGYVALRKRFQRNGRWRLASKTSADG